MVAAFGGKNGRREPGAWTVGPKSAGQSKLHRAQFGVAHNVRNRSQNHKGGVTTDYDGNCPAERSHSNPSFYHNRPDRPDLAPEGILLTKTKQELPADCLNPVGSTLEGHPRVVLPPVRKFVIRQQHTSTIAVAPWYALPFARLSSNHRCPASGRSPATGARAPREMRPRGLRVPAPCAPPWTGWATACGWWLWSPFRRRAEAEFSPRPGALSTARW